MAKHIQIVDVGPRDGLQSQPKLLSTESKVEFITRLLDAGVKRIEVASFVNPKRVPQMADVDSVIARLPKRDDVSYIGLVLNRRGFDRAMVSGIGEINCVVIASDTFNQRNQGATTEETMTAIGGMAAEAQAAGMPCGVTIGASFGCPFEGEVDPEHVLRLVSRLVDLGFGEIALADTIGVAGPSDVARLVTSARKLLGDTPLRCHFHNTRNTGVANAYVAVQEGASVIDASCGGIGGCPFAPAATGNVATEDVLYMLGRMDIETGINIQQIIETAKWLEGPLETQVPAMVTRAGLFPPADAA